ncbi:BTB/POZ domain-containing protein KCTD21-like [Xenia sp. Carnegie-2017]|uniref:BTB/POZ domain-containing protein KCTD21-like n=1 Tax=Xenia sp. Carnegie-2017 TaxID=2897299 RepID=UPI001F04D5B0|nr:BTB/POZ domain-containing protein KCTD21-like [Xenia sp. Carnegie-2017]
MNVQKKSNSSQGFPSVVSLNVGGMIYAASLATLTRYSKSMLAAMFSGRVPIETDANGNYFIDRDGKLFRHVLNFLRSGHLHLPKGFGEFELLKQEVDFYQLKDMMAHLSKAAAFGISRLSSKVGDTSTIESRCYEHVELVCRPRSVEVFGKKATMEECFQKSMFSAFVAVDCTITTEGSANLEVKITNRRGDFVGNEPKTSILEALGNKGFHVVSAGYLQDQKSPVIREVLVLSRVLS